MSKQLKKLALDFVPQPAPGRSIGYLLLLLGAIAVAYISFDYSDGAALRAGLQVRLDDKMRRTSIGQESRPDPASYAEATQIANELNAPWSALLSELEAASSDQHKDIALLSIESDGEKRAIRVVAESRTLSAALAYIRRLQDSKVLRYPTLDSHEVRADDAQRPVRFQITAEWKQTV